MIRSRFVLIAAQCPVPSVLCPGNLRSYYLILSSYHCHPNHGHNKDDQRWNVDVNGSTRESRARTLPVGKRRTTRTPKLKESRSRFIIILIVIFILVLITITMMMWWSHSGSLGGARDQLSGVQLPLHAHQGRLHAFHLHTGQHHHPHFDVGADSKSYPFTPVQVWVLYRVQPAVQARDKVRSRSGLCKARSPCSPSPKLSLLPQVVFHLLTSYL